MSGVASSCMIQQKQLLQEKWQVFAAQIHVERLFATDGCKRHGLLHECIPHHLDFTYKILLFCAIKATLKLFLIVEV